MGFFVPRCCVAVLVQVVCEVIRESPVVGGASPGLITAACRRLILETCRMPSLCITEGPLLWISLEKRPPWSHYEVATAVTQLTKYMYCTLWSPH